MNLKTGIPDIPADLDKNTQQLSPSREEKNIMHWYWQEAGGHTHIRVFMNGGKAGDLCFTNGEFKQIRNEACNIRFHEEQ